MRKDVIAVSVAVLLLAFLLYLSMSGDRVFDWTPTFAHDDDEPFGCELFDKMATATMPKGYAFFNGTSDEFFNSEKGLRTLLLVGENLDLYERNAERLDSFVRKGNKLMLVCHVYLPMDNPKLPWTNFLLENRDYSYFSTKVLERSLRGEIEPDTLNCGNRFRVSADMPLVTVFLNNHLKGFTPTCWLENSPQSGNNSVSAKMRVGRGEVYIVTTPLLFTNYGVLDRQVARFLNFQMEQVADLPVVRMPMGRFSSFVPQTSGGEETENRSPLYVMLERPPLRWAIYTLLAAVLLFMFFTARRRQRRIPVVERPVNRNLEFVRLLGTIYYRRHDHLDLLRKKYTYFAEELRRTLLLDIDDRQNDAANIRLLAQKTGMEEEDVKATLTLVRDHVDSGNVGEKKLLLCIDKINEIIKHL